MRLALVVALLLPARAAALPDPTQPGPFPVGLTMVRYTKTSETTGAPRALDTWIWYPAVRGTGTPSGDVLVDADVARRRSPLIVFSHGSCGFPGQSLFYTQMLASRGFVVAAPAHPGNTIDNCSGTLLDSFLNRPADVRYVIDRLLAEAGERGSSFWRRIHRRRIGVSGHSFGGQTTLRVVAADARVRAGVALAPAGFGDLGIAKPMMVIGGELDSVTPFATTARPAFEFLTGPRFLVEILGAGHCAFAVACVTSGCGVGCPPAGIPQVEAHAHTLRWAVPFLLRYVAGRGRFGRALRPALAPAGVRVEGQRR
jgi:predicted dienelactone hydrolase